MYTLSGTDINDLQLLKRLADTESLRLHSLNLNMFLFLDLVISEESPRPIKGVDIENDAEEEEEEEEQRDAVDLAAVARQDASPPPLLSTLQSQRNLANYKTEVNEETLLARRPVEEEEEEEDEEEEQEEETSSSDSGNTIKLQDMLRQVSRATREREDAKEAESDSSDEE